MRVLVLGSGGREHALASRLAADPGVSAVFCAPGNAGTARVATGRPLDLADPDAALALAARERIDFTIVGPELPLDRGVVDLFARHGRRILGPSRAAAQLECSKVFAKQFMARHGIPTARHRICDCSAEADAVLARGDLGYPVVVKADGLAGGKGVVIAADLDAARLAVRAAMDDRQFGKAGERLVLEECLTGPEVSFFALCDGKRAVPLRSAQDHKRAFDGDRGPNTGGMGAFSPSPLVDDDLAARVMVGIVDPVLQGLAAEGHPYCGFLYTGLMLTADGPKVIEFNVRFGDPEAQVVIPAVHGALAPHLAAAADGSLAAPGIAFTREKLVGVVLASGGYPGRITTGVPIDGLEAAEALDGVQIFHSGTAARDGRVVTAGGRVLTVVGRGASFEDAIERAYAGVSAVSFEGMQYRRDIGARTRGAQTI